VSKAPWSLVIQELRHELELMQSARDLSDAKLSCALDSLAELLRYVRRVNGFMEHEDQMRCRRAEAVLVESGRSVER